LPTVALTLIRRRLLVIAAMATAAIGAGAFLQYLALHEQGQRFALIRADLDRSGALDRVANRLARERGLTLTAMLAREESAETVSAMMIARSDVDAALKAAVGGAP
jgi:hypothetical protein